jgi:TRAP-type C4-dicarboxylate transport system substrate-binding protein
MTSERTITYGSLWPEGHFGRDVAAGFAAAVAEGTDGRITITVTPPSSDDALTKQVIDGQMEMTSGHAIQDYVPELGLGYLPYLYRSFDEFRGIWNLGTPISDAILANVQRRKVPVVVLGYSVIGFRDVILREKQILEASDFKGLKIRYDGSTTSHDTFVAFGAEPQAIEYHMVKDALANGEVEAAANTTFNLIYMGWYEVTKNVSLTSHQILTNLEIVNEAFWGSLSAADQEVFQHAMNDACDRFAADAKTHREEAVTQLAGYGLDVNQVSDATKADLAHAVEPMKNAFVAEYGLQQEYEAILDARSGQS